jgi:hypothetical protein
MKINRFIKRFNPTVRKFLISLLLIPFVVATVSFVTAPSSKGFRGYEALAADTISRTAISNVSCYAIGDSLLLWGTKSGGKSIHFELFDKNLNALGELTIASKTFEADSVILLSQSANFIDFEVRDKKGVIRSRIRVGRSLKAHHVFHLSDIKKFAPADSFSLMESEELKRPIDVLRTDSMQFVLSLDTLVSGKVNVIRTCLSCYRFTVLKGVPIYHLTEKLFLDERLYKAGGILSCTDHKLVIFLDFDMQGGEQYIVGVDWKSPQILYKTRLQDPAVNYFVCSNSLAEHSTGSILIGGTCEIRNVGSSSKGKFGYYLMRLDSAGRISNIMTREPYAFFNAVLAPTAHYNYPPALCQNTYSCITEISRDLKGLITFSVDYYSIKIDGKTQKPIDLNYHYVGSGLYRYPEEFKNTTKETSGGYWSPIYSLSFASVANKNVPKSEINSYPNNIYEINSLHKRSDHYCGFVNDPDNSQTKVLMKRSFLINNKKTSLFEFMRLSSNSSGNSQIRDVSGQDLLQSTKYLIRDESTLFKVTLNSPGYQLTIVNW